MANFNKVILAGNLTQDPELRHTPSGTAVTDLRLAVNHVWFDRQTSEKKTDTIFIDVTLWDRKAETACKFLSRGRSVLVEGRLKMDEWDDRETGQKRSKISVHCDSFEFLDSSRSDGGGGGGGGGNYESAPQSAPSEPAPVAENPAANPPDDEVPF